MKFFRQIQKIEPLADGTIKAYGYASAPVRDAHGEIVTAQAMANAIDEYMRFPAVREMHDASKAAGRALEISLDDNDRTAFVAHVVDPIAVQKVKAGVYSGFSIGGKIKRRNPQDPSIIQEISLMEVSLVDRPSCPEATLDLWKRDEGGPLGEAHRDLMNGARLQKIPSDTPMPDEDADPDDMGPEVDDFQDKGEWDDGFDPKPTGPSTLADGGPYRSSVPDRGADAGRTSMPTDPNSGKSPVGAGLPNSTVDTSGRGGGGGAGNANYFSPTPGATNKGDDSPSQLQRLFDMISEMYAASNKPPIDQAVVVAKGYSTDQRREAAKSGAAMKDGSYPILNRADLADVIGRIDKTKNPAAVKAHLISRARAMDALSMIPDEWVGKSKPAGKEVGTSIAAGAPDSLETKLSKSEQLLQDTLGALERLEVRNRRGKATPEAYRLAKAYKDLNVDELAEVLATDALEKIATNDSKVAVAELTARKYKEDNDALLKQIDETNKGLELLAARLQKLEAQPMPTKTAGSIHVGDQGDQRQFSPDTIAKAKAAFEDMSEEERALLLTKVALQHPRRMNLSPIPSPPRSVGGTAGGGDELR